MNHEHIADTQVQQPQIEPEVRLLEAPQEYTLPEQQEDDSRRAFFRTIAGAAGALAIQTTPGAVVSGVGSYEVAAAASEIAEGSRRARQVASLGSTATSFASKEAPVVSAEVSRRAIFPVAGIVALSGVSRSMRVFRSALRSAMWNG